MRVILRDVVFLLVAGLIAVHILAGEGTAQTSESLEDPAALREELSAKEQELQALSEKLRVLRAARGKKEQEGKRLTTSLEILEGRIQETRLHLDLTEVSIDTVRLRIQETEGTLARLAQRLARFRGELLELLRTLAAADRRSPVLLIVAEGTFSDFLQERQALVSLEERITSLLVATRDVRVARERELAELEGRNEELLGLRKLQEAQKASLQSEEQGKRRLLVQNVLEAARVAARIAEAEEARREIQREIFTLRNVGVRLSLKEAEDLARYAARITGVRPALLLGVLKVESNIGTNVGSGRYPDDVHPAHREAFLRVTEKLGLDPLKTPVSAKPTSYPGWGGAMGPGQIMPGTWERVEHQVARLTGKTVPSPFDLSDAFVATAVILQGAGAAAGNEVEAVNRYFAGPHWQRFTWYGDRVLAVAREYEARGL